MRQIAQNFKGHTRQLVLGPAFKLLEAVLELFVPLVMARLIDAGVAGDAAVLWRSGAALVAIAVGGVVAALICQYFAAQTAGHFGAGLRRQLLGHVLALSGPEAGQFGTGGLITRITNDAGQLQTGVNMFIRLGVRVPFLVIGGLVMALWLNWRMGLVFLCATPLIALVLYVVMRRSLPVYEDIQRRQDDLARLAGESLAGARVIRAFSRQADEQAAFDQQADDMTRLLVRVGRVSAALNPVTGLLVALATVALVWLGGQLTFTGNSTPGQVIAMVTYMNQILIAMIVGANLIVLFTRALASARRVAALLAVAPTITDGPGATPDESAPAIQFCHVTFSYHEGGDPALEDISFTVPRGQTLGIIGGTGSGKSTLARLMLRQYDPQQGRVVCAGHDARQYTLAGLRGRFGAVPQQAQLFSGTVRQNLCLGAGAVADDVLWQALETAQAKAFVQQMDGGLDAEIQQGGKNLSGGQKQRLCIARALVRAPAVLLLDDAASALDYATDAALRRALASRTTAGTTTIIISQRAASLRAAGQILVLDDGRLAASGTHDELLEKSPIYREICQSQGLLPAGGPTPAPQGETHGSEPV